MAERKIQDLFGKPLEVVNLGLQGFIQPMKDQDVPVVDVDWRPPKEGIRHLRVTKSGKSIDEANEEVVSRIK
ncbi:hypothetical protein EG834_05485, partial [bacterium]|nr:hypothetical protein [bacterium]